MAQLVLVEDDDRIAAPLVRALTREGYAVEHFDHGDVDVVLLDLGLPDVDGLDVCRILRERGVGAGILVLSARDHELDLVVGLDSGADDYLAKPFALAELLARVRALLRRGPTRPLTPAAPSAPAPALAPTGQDDEPDGPAQGTPDAGRVRVDRAARRAWVDDQEVALTTKEFDLLALLTAKAGAVITREDAIGRVWDENWFGPTRMLDATLGRLRQKLDDAGARDRITTVRGVGLRMDPAEPEAPAAPEATGPGAPAADDDGRARA